MEVKLYNSVQKYYLNDSLSAGSPTERLVEALAFYRLMISLKISEALSTLDNPALLLHFLLNRTELTIYGVS